MQASTFTHRTILPIPKPFLLCSSRTKVSDTHLESQTGKVEVFKASLGYTKEIVLETTTNSYFQRFVKKNRKHFPYTSDRSTYWSQPQVVHFEWYSERKVKTLLGLQISPTSLRYKPNLLKQQMNPKAIHKTSSLTKAEENK